MLFVDVDITDVTAVVRVVVCCGWFCIVWFCIVLCGSCPLFPVREENIGHKSEN